MSCHGWCNLTIAPAKLPTFAFDWNSQWDAQAVVRADKVIVSPPPFEMQCQLLIAERCALGAADQLADVLADG